jgi:hypothetical protein
MKQRGQDQNQKASRIPPPMQVQTEAFIQIWERGLALGRPRFA